MDMLFLQANSKLPAGGEVTSTARKGDKWSKQTKPGDVLDLKVTEAGALIGRGAVILVEQQTFANVIRKAYQNHAAHKMHATEAEREAVKASLRAAYGDAKDEDVYTVVHFLVLNDEPRYADAAATMKQHGLGNHAAVVPNAS